MVRFLEFLFDCLDFFVFIIIYPFEKLWLISYKRILKRRLKPRKEIKEYYNPGVEHQYAGLRQVIYGTILMLVPLFLFRSENLAQGSNKFIASVFLIIGFLLSANGFVKIKTVYD